jgi:hypothetical protein
VAAAPWYFGWALGEGAGLALAAVMSSPLIGIALAPLVTPLLSGSLRAVRAVAYRDIEGRYYEYKGRPLVVLEDLPGERWIQVKGLRSIIPGLPRDQVLARIASQYVARAEGQKHLLIQAEGLDKYLRRNQDESAVRFRNWLQREVIFPAAHAKRRG